MEDYRNVNKTPLERAKDLLGRLTLAEKMGQVVCFWPRLLPEDEQTYAQHYPCGAGVLAAVYMRMLPTRAEATALLEKIVQDVYSDRGDADIKAWLSAEHPHRNSQGTGRRE